MRSSGSPRRPRTASSATRRPLTSALLAAQPGDRRTSTYTDPFTQYEIFESAGTSFLFDDDGLSAIFFSLDDIRGFTAHDPAEPLIDGLPARPSFDEVRAALGEPYTFDEDDFDVYEVDEGTFVHIEYDMDMQGMIVTLMPRLPRES